MDNIQISFPFLDISDPNCSVQMSIDLNWIFTPHTSALNINMETIKLIIKTSNSFAERS